MTQEQRRSDQERLQKFEEHCIADEERNHRDMLRIFQVVHTGRAPEVTYTSADRFLALKIDLKEFSCESPRIETRGPACTKRRFARLGAPTR